ncbi:DUF4326 domain-containing protein [Halococcus thailandensis]|uniref:SWIM-type domain-containing protein n=1 Tax=Halococcus thailandensis JCM 13552 TaxID=1227457 RepID=M0NI72_9EURY|nr:DUF4326 domain-containing protein [Halococcus thailandensis]EMA56809.1 hypothetical protein C451_00345 [Halococcus thailandensis JCM 13552]
MSDRNLTVARLVDDEIGGIEIEDSAFGDLLSELGISPKIEKRTLVQSSKPGDDDTRGYIVSLHTVPGTDGAAQVYSCTCAGYKFHQLLSHADAIRDDPETGFERLGRCKHGDAVAVADRTTEDREGDQQGFDTFADGGTADPDAIDRPGHGRPGGVDEPDPDAAYQDEPPEHAPPCDDCGEQPGEQIVQCPIDEERRLDLCPDCYDERGPGIEICHVRRDEDWDVNGGRASPNVRPGEKRHMGNTAFPAPGWIGNPHPMEEDTEVERWRVLKAFRRDLLEKVRDGEFFAYHLGKLRGKRVACWCRSEREDWPDGDGDPCHLDVVHAALMGLYTE